MNQILADTLYILGGYVALLVFLLVAINWIQKGFMWQFLKVRASRGARMLVEIYGVNDVYYKASEKTDGVTIRWKNRAGKMCREVSLTPDAIINIMGVQKIQWDEVNNGFWSKQGAYAQGNDPQQVDNIINRALQSPLEKTLLVKLVIITLIVIVLFILAQVAADIYIYNVLEKFSVKAGIV